MGEAAATPPGPSPTDAKSIDAKSIEELAKLQRGLRRLSLAHEQHGEQLQGVAARLQELDQNVMRLAAAVDGPQYIEAAVYRKRGPSFAADCLRLPSGIRLSAPSYSLPLAGGGQS